MGGSTVRTPLVLAAALVFGALVSGPVLADGDGTEGRAPGKQKTPSARDLAKAVVRAVTSSGEERRAEAEAMLAAAPMQARGQAYVDQLDHGLERVRRYALDHLIDLGGASAVPALPSRVVKETKGELRVEVLRHLQRFDVKGTGGLFVAYLGSDRRVERLRAIQGMGLFPDPRTVPYLIRHLRVARTGGVRTVLDIHTSVARVRDMQSSLVRLASSDVPITTPTVELLDVETHLALTGEALEISLTTGVLQTITGEGFGPDPDAWELWYRRQAAESPER